jgi:hypothetical protein
MKLCALALFAFALAARAGDLPDPVATPGAVNAAVTQENVKATICVPGWTKTIRPPASYTNKLKRRQMASGPYQSAGAPHDFEEDHLISLEIGGDPVDPRNLWPQHWAAPFGAHQKDQLENYLHRAVCAGRLTLAEAQAAAASDWIAAYKRFIK